MGKGEGDVNFGEENHDFYKLGAGKNIKFKGTLYTPEIFKVISRNKNGRMYLTNFKIEF